jgi:hypothetical protein
MIWIIIIGFLLIIIACFLILRIGITVEYSEDGLRALFFAGPIKVRVYPSSGKTKRKKRAPKEPEDKLKKGGPVKRFRELLSIFSYVSEKLRRRFTIDKLILYYLAAGNDAAHTALSFGMASAGAGLILPVLENIFIIKNKDVRTAVSFTEQESYIYFKARMSVAMRVIPYIAVVFGYRYKYMQSKQQVNKPNT